MGIFGALINFVRSASLASLESSCLEVFKCVRSLAVSLLVRKLIALTNNRNPKNSVGKMLTRLNIISTNIRPALAIEKLAPRFGILNDVAFNYAIRFFMTSLVFV